MTLDHVPFAKLLGIEVDAVEPGHAVLSMKLRHEHMRNNAFRTLSARRVIPSRIRW